MKPRALAAALGLAALAACSAAPQTPAQAVFALQAAFDAALDVAVGYASLPRCAPDRPAPCSEAARVARANDVAQNAWRAIRAAEAAARAPGGGADARAGALAAAEAALAELIALTASMKE
jgi:hypothetical protein